MLKTNKQADGLAHPTHADRQSQDGKLAILTERETYKQQFSFLVSINVPVVDQHRAWLVLDG